jgi:signal transduction histidine kinase
MEIFLPELHNWPLRAFLDEASDTFGEDALRELLNSYGLQLQDFVDASAWISLEFVEALLQGMVELAGDPEFFDRATRRGMSAKYIGPLYPLFRAFGSPRFSYNQLARAAGRVNKTGQWVADSLGPGSMRMRWIPRPGAPQEAKPFICRTRFLQLGLIPGLFDLPLATVEHPECALRGNDACVYEVRWQEAPRQHHALVGALVGASIGAACASSGTAAPWLYVMLSAGFALGGWAIGRVLVLRQEVRRRVKDIDDHNRALDGVTRVNEQRFEELRQAKAEVELKVEERTRELSAASARLSETLAEIQQLDRAKTDFFNNVSHELRSPLTLILAPLQELVAGRIPPGGENVAFEAMHRSAGRLLRLINQLLDLAKIDAGEMKIALAPVDVMDLVRAALKGFDAAAEEKGVRLELRGPEQQVPPIALDAAWIESAVTNLLANALRLTPRGGGVRVRVEHHGGDVSISVADDGPGIAPDEQQKVFERFAQGDSTKRVVGGTGIGLALVREAARLHGGDTRLTSALGSGATFTMVLPTRVDLPLDLREASTTLAPAKTAFAESFSEEIETLERGGPSGSATLALVVEDNPELRAFIANVLATRYRVRAVSDGAKALALLKNLRPDVIVSDVAMPVMDGYALCRNLRANPETNTIPVLLVTARTDMNSILEGFDAGANDYLLKPFHGRELLARVDVHVRLRRMAQELALRERHAMLGVLAASVAHQVRNPLTTLVSGLPAMRARLDGHINQRTFELIDVMIDCAGRIDRLTGDLMDLSRVDREVGGDFRPSDGLRSAIRMMQARVPEGVVVEERIESSPIISGRPGDMNHVFMNLLDNAVRAVGERGKIRIDSTLEAGAYTIRISDTGSGVDAEIASRIFEPFFTTRPAGEGTGLGLAIANQVMQQCGGSIQVGRADLGGAEFTVRIPIAPSVTSSALSAADADSSTVH